MMKRRSPVLRASLIVGVLIPLTLSFEQRLHAQDSSELASTESAVKAVERGLGFLISDAAAWRNEKKCATCHHGLMTVWSLMEGKLQGYAVDSTVLADNVKWTKDRVMERIDLPRDTRPGWSMVNSPAIYLSVMAAVVPQQDIITTDDLSRIGQHLVRHQEADGSWKWSSAPPANRPPPFFESDEVATLLSCIALRNRNTGADDATRKVLEDGEKWLEAATPTETTQAVAFRLLAEVQRHELGDPLQPDCSKLFALQQADGGWAQIPGATSDAYATGQALYVLSLAGIKGDTPEIRRAATFLVRTQNEDGSWTMTRRGHPGVTPSDYIVPIRYLGTAWATLGLIRSTPH